MGLGRLHPSPAPARFAAVVIGAGNIGSQLLNLARIPQIARIAVIDPDAYTQSNLSSQAISAADVGEPKAEVLARSLGRINPGLEVEAIVAAVENVPLGRLRAHLWLSCLDSKAARLMVSELALRLGTPVWLDAGVAPSTRLARVSIFTPGPDSACIACEWTDDDFRNASLSYACDGSGIAAPPTNDIASPGALGIASLGALAAAQQALECQVAIESGLQPPFAAHEILIDAAAHRSHLSRLQRNADCRCDHEAWKIDRLPPGCRSLGDLTALAENRGCAPRLRIEGHAFVSDIRCRGCGRGAALSLISTRAAPSRPSCPTCGRALAVGFDAVVEEIDLTALPAAQCSASLCSVGLRSGHVFSLGDRARARHFELAAGTTA